MFWFAESWQELGMIYIKVKYFKEYHDKFLENHNKYWERTLLINGPELYKFVVVINEAMNLFLKNKGGYGSWHFLETSVIEKFKHYDGDSEDS